MADLMRKKFTPALAARPLSSFCGGMGGGKKPTSFAAGPWVFRYVSGMDYRTSGLLRSAVKASTKCLHPWNATGCPSWAPWQSTWEDFYFLGRERAANSVIIKALYPEKLRSGGELILAKHKKSHFYDELNEKIILA